MSEKEKENEKIAALEQRAAKAEADLKKAQDDASANATSYAQRGYRKMIHKIVLTPE